jgi:KipI family sensor histidine kinase inhibitor
VSAHRIVLAGDSAVTVEFANRIDAAVNARAVALAESVRAAAFPGVRDVVPTFCSVAVYFDPLRTDADALLAHLDREAAREAPEPAAAATPVRIPVCYGGAFGPDLAGVARFAGMSEAETIELHSGPVYRVFMLGFVPGFAYLGTVDPRIAAPRRPTPRVRVPAGSIGIAGAQTGIYPSESPGGWQLVGRTPVKPFDLGRLQPFLLQPGDTVRFYRIEPEDYEIAGSVDSRIAEGPG